MNPINLNYKYKISCTIYYINKFKPLEKALCYYNNSKKCSKKTKYISGYVKRVLRFAAIFFQVLALLAFSLLTTTSPVLFSIFGSGLNPNSIGLSNSFLSGILIMFGLLCLYRGLQMGPVSIVAPIAAINPLFVFLIRYALGSEPTLLQWMATIVVISGAILVSVSADSHQESLGLNKQQIKEIMTSHDPESII